MKVSAEIYLFVSFGHDFAIDEAALLRQIYGEHCRLYNITINVPVVFMARYIMVLRGATSLRGALEGVGPENRDFLGP